MSCSTMLEGAAATSGERPANLSRRLSTPARIKQTIEHRQQAKKLTLCSRSLSCSVGDTKSTDHNASPPGGYCIECHLEPDHHHHHHRNHVSAASDSPSSASDSAFSQSQTTLESDSSCGDQSSGAWRSLKADNRRRLLAKQKSAGDNKETGGDSSPPGDSADEEASDEDREDAGAAFKIIWSNLSYRVPEKRYARARSFLQRQKEALWPAKDDDTIGDDQSSETTCPEPPEPGPPAKAANGGNQDDHEPPMRAPTSGKPRRLIFSGLNGCVKSGQLTAILGPSGAGKTTFLKCLTNSIVKGVSGSIDIHGGGGEGGGRHSSSTSQREQPLKLCIIPQKDYLFDNLTVMENLLFASRIKNTQQEHNDEPFDHMENVERVADLLGLRNCLRLKTNKLSGGQYKRVSIAQELLSKPDILILDEPTSGLDSLTCFRTVSVLRDLANRSRAGLIPQLAIIMTIHQPQIKIFNLFHHVYILSSMGQCVYEGRPDHLIDTVADCCKLLPPADDLNPASFVIALASEVYGQEPISQLAKLQRENFHLHRMNIMKKELKEKDKEGCIVEAATTCVGVVSIDLRVGPEDSQFPVKLFTNGATSGGANGPDYNDEGFTISSRLKRRNREGQRIFWHHTWLLVKRLWISMWRDPLLTTTRVTFHLIIPFVFYFIYSQKSGAANACPYVEREFDLKAMTSEENIRRLEVQHNELILTFENTSLFFLLLYSFSMCVLAVTALSFPLNMQILLKETSNGWYSMPRFVMAKTIADLPMELSMPMISVGLAYFLTGQPSSYLCWRMLTVTAVMTLCSLISQTQGLLFGAYFMNNVQAAVFVSQASSLPWIMLSGFTTRISELPKLLQWLSFGSIYRLGIESIVSVRYGFGMCPCDEEVVDGSPARLVGIPDQLRSVVNYYMDSMAPPSLSSSSADSAAATATAKNSSSEDIFEKIASTMSRANTYGVDVTSCHDVRPFIMSAREVDEQTLPTFLIILFLIFVALKILLFCVVRFRAG